MVSTELHSNLKILCRQSLAYLWMALQVLLDFCPQRKRSFGAHTPADDKDDRDEDRLHRHAGQHVLLKVYVTIPVEFTYVNQ